MAATTDKLRKAAEGFMALDRYDKSLPSQLMFLIPYAIWLVLTILVLATSFSELLGPHVNMVYLEWAVLGVLLLREVLFGRWDRRAFVGAVVFAFLALMAHRAGIEVLFEAAIIVFAGRNVPFRRIAWVSLFILAGLVVLVSLSSQVGIVPDAIVTGGGRSKHSLGFVHPNTGPAFAFFALCVWVYLRGKKYGIFDAAAWIAITAVLLMFTDSRTSCGLSFALAVVAFAAKFIPDKAFRSPPLAVIGIGSVALCAVLAISLTACYDPSVGWMSELNRLLSYRIQFGHNVIAEFGFPLFGASLDMIDDGRVFDIGDAIWVPTGNSTGSVVDCAYVYMLMYFGVAYVVIELLLVLCANYKAWRAANWQLLIVIGFIALHGIAEMCFPYLHFNPLLFLLGGLFYAGYDGYASISPARIRLEEGDCS